MRQGRASFSFAGIPVYLPGSAFLGIALVAWVAWPTAEGLAQGDGLVALVALGHAIAVYLVVFIHELGHSLVARRLGYPVAGIVLHIIGGHTAFQQRFRTPGHQVWIALAGPLATGGLGLIGWFAFGWTDTPILQSVLGWMNWTALVGSVLNLLPGAPLDGGAALSGVIWRFTGNERKGMVAAGYGGLLVAALWASLPWFVAAATGNQPDLTDLLLSWFIGTWLAVAAFGQIRQVKRPAATQNAEAVATPASDWRLVVRRACPVAPYTDTATAVAEANAVGAGAIVLVSDGQPIGIVREAALAAVPFERRGETPVTAVARRVSQLEWVRADVGYADFLQEWRNLGADEWLVVDEAGRVFGVAVRQDQRGISN